MESLLNSGLHPVDANRYVHVNAPLLPQRYRQSCQWYVKIVRKGRKAPKHEEKDSTSAHGTPPVLSSYTVTLASLASVPSRKTSE